MDEISSLEPVLKALGSNDVNTARKILTTDESASHAVDENGRGAYVYAIAADSMEGIILLHDLGVSARVIDNAGQSPLHWAATFNRVDIVGYLLSNNLANPDVDDAGVTPLHWACVHGDPTMAKVLLQQRDTLSPQSLEALIHCQDDQGLTALHWAVQCGRARVLKVLLKAGADPTRCDLQQHTALHHLCMQAMDSPSSKMGEQQACKHNTGPAAQSNHNTNNKPGAISNPNGDEHTPSACLVGSATPLLTSAVWPSAPSQLLPSTTVTSMSSTSISRPGKHVAGDPAHAMHGNGSGSNTELHGGGHGRDSVDDDGCDTTQAPVSETGNIINGSDSQRQQDVSKRTAENKHSSKRDAAAAEQSSASFCIQDFATLRDNRAFKQRLKRCHRRRRYRTGGPLAPSSKCRELSHLDCMLLLLRSAQARQLLTAPDQHGQLAVHLAAANNRVAMLEGLLSHPAADVHAEDSDGRTPLHWACAVGSAEAAHVLMCARADAHRLDIDSFTPAHHAAAHGHFVCLRVLVAHDQSAVGVKDRNGRTPLLWAATQRKGAFICRILVQSGADMHAEDTDTLTPVSACIIAGCVETFRCFVELSPFLCDDTLVPLVLLAASNRQPAMLCVLLDYRAWIMQERAAAVVPQSLNVNAHDESDMTALMYACNYDDLQSVDALLRHNADVSRQDEQGLTALHWAAARGAVGCVSALLAHPAVAVNALDKSDDRSTPLDYAVGELEASPSNAGALTQVCDLLIKAGGETAAEIIPRAALCIQKHWKGYKARSEFQAKRRAVGTIASWFRQCYAAKMMRGDTATARAVLILQSAFRGYRVRKRHERDLRAMRNRIRKRQRAIREKREREEHEAKLAALRKSRGSLSKKERRATLMRLQLERSRRASRQHVTAQLDAQAESRARQQLTSERLAQLEVRFEREKRQALLRLQQSMHLKELQDLKHEQQRHARSQRLDQVADMKKAVANADTFR
ncbi:hypothetical protein PTSG_04219 [Salpingoeca rosetta]|uniref:Uncharacterized protein n=1 Tax=Salpingoeca rosetta (strain ATCC 50818 / BSB-021) TaxID=946362 RepID=F2U6X9_SALR5|nr:uncharacterized protein PTSG_04219 [Salpingoeca rosetta]EGD83611.1 hypothetical protein PTSG_04219 [Salpingoeca rosetta]|eukprot:XP_004995115.1 hypothetical protein PTSG_04219 [Salpingoeca rosetta]